MTDATLPHALLALFALYAVVINLAAFTAFWIDKSQARANGWRISEARLLELAFLGGSRGAYAARRLFRHKTRKQPLQEGSTPSPSCKGVALTGLLAARLVG